MHTARTKDILNSIDYPVFVLNKEYEYIYWNRASEVLTGISEEEAIGKSLFDLFPAVEGTATHQAYQEVMKSGRGKEIEVNYDLGGEDFWFELNITPFEGGITVVTKDISEKKTLELELKEANEIINETKKIAGVGFWRVDTISGTTHWDDTVYAIHELDRSVKVNLNEAIDFYHVDYRGMVEEQVNIGIEEQSKWDFEAVLVTATGKEKWVRAFGYPVVKLGQVVELRGLFIDIDERKREEREKALAIEQIETLFHNIGDFVCLHDPDGTYRKVSPSSLEITGYSADELVGKDPYDFFHPEDRKVVLELGHLPISRGEEKKTELEFRYRHKEGHYIWLSTTTEAIFDEEKNVVQLVTSSKDVSENKRERAEMRSINDQLESRIELRTKELNNLNLQLEQQFEALEVSTIFSITDKVGNITHVNQKFVDISGYSEDELIGQNHRILKSGRQPKEVFSDMWDTISNGRSWTGEICNKTKNGEIYWVYTTIYPLKDETGQVTRYISVRFDITDMKDQAEELQQKTSELEKAKLELSRNLEKERELSEIKSRFIATASHQFRTPISVIQANLGILSITKESMDSEFQSRFDRIFDKVKGQIRKMTDLMDEVLILSKIDNGNTEVRAKAVDTIDVCRKIVDNFNEMSNRERVILNVTGEKKELMLDVNMFEHSLSNFISNALKYSSSEEDVRVSLKFEKVKLVIIVEDKGIGVPEDDLRRIFEPFYRATNTVEYQGTGLGLSIAKEYIELNNGDVFVESKVGRGTTVSINYYY